MFLSFLVLCGWWPEAAHLPSSPGGRERPCGYCMWSGWATGRMRSLSCAANSAVGAGGFSILISRLSGGRELFGCTMGPAGFHERKTLPSPVRHFMETSEQPRQQAPRAARSMAAAAWLSPQQQWYPAGLQPGGAVCPPQQVFPTCTASLLHTMQTVHFLSNTAVKQLPGSALVAASWWLQTESVCNWGSEKLPNSQICKELFRNTGQSTELVMGFAPSTSPGLIWALQPRNPPKIRFSKPLHSKGVKSVHI